MDTVNRSISGLMKHRIENFVAVSVEPEPLFGPLVRVPNAIASRFSTRDLVAPFALVDGFGRSNVDRPDRRPAMYVSLTGAGAK